MSNRVMGRPESRWLITTRSCFSDASAIWSRCVGVEIKLLSVRHTDLKGDKLY